MGNNRQALLPNRIYHVYNHAVGKDNLFANTGNYEYFLKRYAEYLFGVFDTYCYCLLPNHYHFLIRVRDIEDIEKALPKPNSENPLSLPDRLAHQVGTFQNAYAKAFNKQQSRRGSLFEQSFGRKEVKSAAYFSSVVHYIHANAVHHGFVRKIDDWAYTSYHSYLSKQQSKLNREEVIGWFGELPDFVHFHQTMAIDERLILEMEDF